jgi:Arm DNA-binding domain
MPKTKLKHKPKLTQAAVERLKPDPRKRLPIPDSLSPSLFLMIYQSGHKSWMMRFRTGKMVLGPLDISGRRHEGELEFIQPLTLVQARLLASRVNADRAAGIDVISQHKARKHRQRVAIIEASTNSFAAAAKDFHHRTRQGQDPQLAGDG